MSTPRTLDHGSRGQGLVCGRRQGRVITHRCPASCPILPFTTARSGRGAWCRTAGLRASQTEGTARLIIGVQRVLGKLPRCPFLPYFLSLPQGVAQSPLVVFTIGWGRGHCVWRGRTRGCGSSCFVYVLLERSLDQGVRGPQTCTFLPFFYDFRYADLGSKT